MSEKFKVGDVVELNSGGPEMSVTKVIDANSDDIQYMIDKKELVYTTWFIERECKEAVFPPETLRKIKI